MLLAVLACLAFGTWASAQTDAGTLIVNQARAVVRGEVVVPSNQVATVVQAVCGVRLLPLPDGTGDPPQSATVVHGGSAEVAFRLVNVGNAAHTFTLDVRAGAGAWAPTGLAIYHDVTHSGRRDPGDPLVTQMTLDPRGHEAFVLVVDAPATGTGTLDVTVTARCAPAAHRAPDAGVEATTSARLQLHVRTAPAVNPRVQLDEVSGGSADPRPVHATIDVVNLGGGHASPVELVVPFEATGGCLTFDPDAFPPAAVEADGADVEVQLAEGWRSLADYLQLVREGLATGADARALRVRHAELTESQGARVRFGLQLHETACADVASLDAIVRAGGDESRTTGHLPVVRLPASSLAPVPDPHPPHLVVGHARCFDFELRNVGRLDDVYTLSATTDLPADQAPSLQLALRSRADLPLDAEIALAPGEHRAFRACLTADDPIDAFELAVRADSRAGAAPAHAHVAVAAALHGQVLHVRLTADPAAIVVAGSLVRFEAVLRNALPFDLSDVRARFEVLEAARADGTPVATPFLWHGGDDGVEHDPDTGVLRWSVASLPAGAEHRVAFELRARADLPDDAHIDTIVRAHAAELGDGLAGAVTSAAVRHTVWSSELLATLRAQPERVFPGDRLTVTVRVFNRSDRPIRATLVAATPDDTTPMHARGHEEPPTAAGQAEAPDGEAPTLARLWLGAGDTAEAVFVMRVAADPGDLLRGGVRITAVSEAGTDAGELDLAFAVPVERGPFARDRGVLVGHVFTDDRGDGRFAEPSAGLAGVRVLLSDGRQTVSDEHGRFAFRDVPVGWWRVQFDPATLPAPLAASPTRVGPSAHRVLVQGVARLDVPVEPLAGRLRFERSTELRHGPLTVAQTESPVGDMTLRLVTLHTTEPLEGLVVRWTDAQGAVREWHVGRLEERAERAFVVPASAAPADPEVTWHRE